MADYENILKFYTELGTFCEKEEKITQQQLRFSVYIIFLKAAEIRDFNQLGGV